MSRSVFIAEPSAGDKSRVRATDLTTNEGQKRYLMAELGVTGPQAKALIRAYILDQRDADARHAAGEEFSAWFRRRGDLLLVRGRVRMPWRVSSS